MPPVMKRPRILALAVLIALVAAAAVGRLLLRQEADLPTAPLVLDLNGDGIELLQAERSRVYFDIDHDGYAERIGWASNDDGVLVVDGNGNGVVDDIAEFLGTEDWKLADLHGAPKSLRLASGFNMLRKWDDNGDGAIDASDAAFDRIVVWRDADDDGRGQPDELLTLAREGIAYLSTESAQEIASDGENTITDIGEFGRPDGTKGRLVSVRFGFDGSMTRFLGPVTIDSATAALPRLNGYGMAKDLSAAMSEDEKLFSIVADFTRLTVADMPDVESRIEEILFRWYRTDGTDPSSRGPNIDARWIATLERVYGKPWRGPSGSPDPAPQAALLLMEAWRDIMSTFSVRLLAQTPLGQVLFPGLAYEAMAFIVIPDILTLDDALANLRRHSPGDAGAKLRYWSTAILVLDALYPEFKEVVAENDRSGFERHFVAAIDAALAADGVGRTYMYLSCRDEAAANSCKGTL